MSEIFDKWNEEFGISDPNTEPRNFLLLKDYLFHFDKNKADEEKKLTVHIMRQNLIELGIDIEVLLKVRGALKDKYNEFFSGQLSP